MAEKKTSLTRSQWWAKLEADYINLAKMNYSYSSLVKKDASMLIPAEVIPDLFLTQILPPPALISETYGRELDKYKMKNSPTRNVRSEEAVPDYGIVLRELVNPLNWPAMILGVPRRVLYFIRFSLCKSIDEYELGDSKRKAIKEMDSKFFPYVFKLVLSSLIYPLEFLAIIPQLVGLGITAISRSFFAALQEKVGGTLFEPLFKVADSFARELSPYLVTGLNSLLVPLGQMIHFTLAIPCKLISAAYFTLDDLFDQKKSKSTALLRIPQVIFSIFYKPLYGLYGLIKNISPDKESSLPKSEMLGRASRTNNSLMNTALSTPRDGNYSTESSKVAAETIKSPEVNIPPPAGNESEDGPKELTEDNSQLEDKGEDTISPHL